MIPEKVTWVQFPARINTVYSKLPPINDLFLKILNQTQIFAIDFLPEYQIRNFFQLLCCIRTQFVETNSSTFCLTFCIMLIWPFQKQFLFSLYLQRCELAIFNSQIKIFPLMLLMQLNFDSTLYQFSTQEEIMLKVKETYWSIFMALNFLFTHFDNFFIMKLGHFPFALTQGLFSLTISQVYLTNLVAKGFGSKLAKN